MAGKDVPHVEHPALEDWSSDCGCPTFQRQMHPLRAFVDGNITDAFDDATNPFVVVREEGAGPIDRRPLVPAIDNSTNDSQQSPSKMLPPPPLSPSPLANTPPARCDTLPEQKATTPPPAHAHAPRGRRATRPRRTDPSDCRWQAPGPSPLSRSFSAAALAEQDDLSLSASDSDDDDECFARAFRRHTRGLRRPTSVRPLPRTLNGSSGGRKGSSGGSGSGRVPPPLRRELHRNRFLSRVCFLDVEAPELDSVDERNMEWLLDTQADLLRGRRAIPALAHLAPFGVGTGDAPRLGTSHRRLKWVRGSGFPRRVKDYGSAAEDMLARRRAMEGAMMA